MNWANVPLAEVAEIVSGATPRTGEERFWGGDILWTTPKDISDLDTAYLDRPPRTITVEGLKSCATSLLPANSVLLSSRAPIGLVAINRQPVATNQGFKSLVPDRKRLDSKFLYYWLRSRTSYLQGLGNGATFKEISKAVVERIEIPLPPLDEQRRIAAILDKADALRRKRKRALEILDTLTQSIFLEMFGDPVANSNQYPIVEVGAVTSCIVPGRDKPKSFTGSIPWVTTADLNVLGYTSDEHSKSGLTDQEVEGVRAKIVPTESVLLTCVGDLGVVSVAAVPMVINQQLHSFQCTDRIVPEYLMYALSYQTAYMFSRATQTTLPYMNKSVCNSIPIQLPPIGAQLRFRDEIGQIAGSRRRLDAHGRIVTELFSSLQQRAFSGHL